MQNGRVIHPKEPPNGGKAPTGAGVGKVAGNLAGDDNMRAAGPPVGDVLEPYPEFFCCGPEDRAEGYNIGSTKGGFVCLYSHLLNWR